MSTLEISDKREIDENLFVAIFVDFPNLSLMDKLALKKMNAQLQLPPSSGWRVTMVLMHLLSHYIYVVFFKYVETIISVNKQ